MMSSGDTPAVARRKVRLAIKDARNAKGDTQTQVAEAMEWSLSKVMRIESGEVTISQNDLKPLLTYLGVKDRAIVDPLVQAAKASRQRKQWWDDKRYNSLLTPAMRQLFGFEAEAIEVRTFSPTVLPGWLQTESYAHAIMQPFRDELDDDVIDARAAMRTERREVLRRRDPRPQMFAILDESVLLREFGGRETSRGQFAEITDLIAEGWLHIRIHPMQNPFSPFGHYDLLYLPPATEGHAVLYRESGTVDEVVDEKVRITRHRAAWDQMWDSSMSEKESAARIAAVTNHPAVVMAAGRLADPDTSG